MAENNEVAIPIKSVVAKPKIKPVPKKNKTIPVMAVVTFESMIEESAFLKPSETAVPKGLPKFSSSLIRS